MTTDTRPRDSRTALLDAAERQLIDRGHAVITVRSVAAEAGVNHGLVRYHFQTLDNLLLESFDRFSNVLFERQRVLYAEDRPFIEKWRTAMGFLKEDDREAGYSKLWLEMQAMAWNRPDLEDRVREVNAGWRAILVDAIGDAMDGYGVDTGRFPIDAIVSLVMTFNLGIQMEAVSGVTEGHRELLEMIDGILVGLESNTSGESV